jgi:phosphatidylserine/phosphatidylglycerophosphate/cardiolipin synthase-like enzyme
VTEGSRIDFAEPQRLLRAGLVSGRGHYERVVEAVRGAELSVWVATANLKELMVEPRGAAPARRGGGRRRWQSVLVVLDDLARRGVELRILHATTPSRAFRERFDRLEGLADGGLRLRACPRVHLKVVVVDAALLYLGSANWTGAGLGAKGEGRRNFELGIVTDDEGLIDEAQRLFDRIWSGAECARCRLRDACESPLDRGG